MSEENKEKKIEETEEVNDTAILENAKKHGTGLVIVDKTVTSNTDVVCMNRSTIKKLNLFEGFYVLLRGRVFRHGLFIVEANEMLDDGTVAMSSVGCRNTHAKIGDTVYVVKETAVNNVKSIVLNPIRETTASIGSSENMFKDYVLPYFSSNNRPVSEGAIVQMGGNGCVEFMVDKLVLEKGAEESRRGNHGIVIEQTKVKMGDPISREEANQDAQLIGYDDVGGCRKQLAQMRELVELPLRHKELFTTVGINPSKGVLLYGPPGTGKTLMVRAISNETGVFLYLINGPEIMSKMAGESESNLRRAFDKATEKSPSIIFIDEIDSIAPKRENTQGEVEKRIVSQLLTLMDGMNPRANVIVIGATNRQNSIDAALRRFGRFDKELEIGVPDTEGRLEILKIHTRKMKLKNEEPGKVNLEAIAKDTHGYVGSDLAALCTEAALHQIRSVIPKIDLEQEDISEEILSSMYVTQADFEYAMRNTSPNTLREAVVEIPETKWSDIGGLEDLKQELREMIQYPIVHPEKYEKFGMEPSKGILFYGPPGCGKTLMARAIASECGVNFISIKGPELMNMWVGQSEANVRDVFDKARASAPCVLFFDELDSIASSRSGGGGGDNKVGDRVLNQMLTEMGGIGKGKNVFVIGATNRPEQLDPAILRPGRLDQLVYVRLPDRASRLAILKAVLKKTKIAEDVNLEYIAECTGEFSGADMTEICQTACKLAIREAVVAEEEYIKKRREEGDEDPDVGNFENPVREVAWEHFEVALKRARKSVTESEIQRYERFAQKMKSSTHIGRDWLNKDKKQNNSTNNYDDIYE